MLQSSPTDQPVNLGDAANSLLEHFGNQLSGARQATRRQMVQYLARRLHVSERRAEEAFDRLQSAGAVTWCDEAPNSVAPTAEHHRHGWNISTSVFDEAEADVALPQFEAAGPPEELTPAADLLTRAIGARATDIHLDPFGDEVEVRFRIDGRLEHYCRLNQEIANHLVTQFKVMAELDIAEPFHPKEGRLQLPVSMSDYEVRITTTPVTGGEAIALRILQHQRLLRPLVDLGLSEKSLDDIGDLLRHREGIVLVTGPTGSGKSTTLYSMVHAVDDGHRNIVSIEDPVEFQIPSFLQVEVDRQHDMSMIAGLRTLLRMDPDIVLVGEIRGQETADVAMRAASSGKYVFSTFHTRDVASTVTALRDLHVDSRSMAGNLRALISQRLVRRLCPDCRAQRPIEEHQRETFQRHGLEAPEQLWHPAGCAGCRQTGFFERIGVFEVEVNNSAVAMAIEHGAAEDELRDLLRRGGSLSLAQDALLKVRDGITSLDEALSMSWVSFSKQL